MKTIGLTGGIGSGKSTVAAMFGELGVPVYIADNRARELVDSSKIIRQEISTLLGEQAYMHDRLDREYVAQRVFSDKELLAALNAIIHPRVRDNFRDWKYYQSGPYCIMEAAILFENGGYRQCDLTILVTAPQDLRIRRVMERDRLSKKDVLARMDNQWPDEKKLELADFVIENTDLEKTRKRVLELHRELSESP